jgi:hypothetical protein
MRLIRVVEAGILSFLRGEMSIECLRLETDFRNELALKESLEVLGVGGFRLGEHARVDELINCWGLHLTDGQLYVQVGRRGASALPCVGRSVV